MKLLVSLIAASALVSPAVAIAGPSAPAKALSVKTSKARSAATQSAGQVAEEGGKITLRKAGWFGLGKAAPAVLIGGVAVTAGAIYVATDNGSSR